MALFGLEYNLVPPFVRIVIIGYGDHVEEGEIGRACGTYRGSCGW